jgi:pyruvate dehydrogenase E2 component (dihydrolipoyllysine-residue acetyltransferase)
MPAHDETSWVAVSGDHGDDISYQRIAANPEALPADAQRTADETAAEINATQGALEAAAELGVDLSSVSGTGAEGRITKADVEAAAAE